MPTYFRMDKILYRMGLLSRDESLASRIPWWPLISVLGTFSSGKSTFINHYIGDKLQSTGNQAVDDKFTVICFGGEGVRVLPGTALDADPRFPFYRMSDEIDKVAAGEGRRIDAYLQLKTTGNDTVRGKIIIDSPGFDADDQRRSILRLTNHIVDLSDLVLVFFDARHPEPGAMQDTLRHLVASTVRRPDASKFLYILNQIDTAAREDNPEDVVGAWQRAVAQAGLVSGRFYCIYNPGAAVEIPDEGLRRRFEAKRDADLAEIHARMGEVEVQRSYRIISVLEMVANEVEQELVPVLTARIARWRRLTLVWDLVGALGLAGLAGVVAYFVGLDSLNEGAQWLASHQVESSLVGILVLAVVVSGHLSIRDAVARHLAQSIPERAGQFELGLRQAFLKSTSLLRSIFGSEPSGWGKGTRRRLQALRNAAAQHIQRVNDLYTDPSGRRRRAELSDGKVK
ncbi:MAG: dynamin family protein [Alphaproteobacteria bacterium]